jgi:hypothetical protein
MNWDIVAEITKREATEYANSKSNGNQLLWLAIYSAYFAGKMKDAAERESLRVIASHKSAPTLNLDDLV